jgi:predicted AAA+ superfamily ATPase
MENMIFLQLKRDGNEIYYHKGKYECDFVIRKNGQIVNAIQVCQSLGQAETRSREINGLLEAMKQYQLLTGTIITEDEEETININQLTIQVVPAWRWLL